jgi:hypothetical protein
VADFEYSLTRVCRRGGKEYYLVYPDSKIGTLPKNFEGLRVLVSHPKFSVVSFPDCNVTLFASGRMLIEDLVEDSEARAHAVVRQILSIWLKPENTPTHP